MSNKFTELSGELRKTIAHMDLVLSPLISDVVTTMDALKRDPSSQYWGRVSVRAYCGLVEAMVYQMKATTLKIASLLGTQFAKDEMEVLTETRTIATLGKPPQQRAKFIPLADNLKLTCRLFASVHAVEFQLDTSGPGFADFQHLIDVRNRITHPKKVFDVEVRASDHARGVSASQWFEVESDRLMALCSAKVPELVARAKARR